MTNRILTHGVFLQAMGHGVLDLPTPRVSGLCFAGEAWASPTFKALAWQS